MKPQMHINNSVDGYYSEKIFNIKQTTQDRSWIQQNWVGMQTEEQ